MGHMNDNFRVISTYDTQQLAKFQENKHRRYTQLQPGKIKAEYIELNLGIVQVFRETLNVGARIEAAPDPSFVPFASIYSGMEEATYLGQTNTKNKLIQASGGNWDVRFNNNFKYVCAAFNREGFDNSIAHLMNRDVPQDWLVSKLTQTCPKALGLYTVGLSDIIDFVQSRPEIVNSPVAQKSLSDTALQLALNVLNATLPYSGKISPQPRRIRGVKKIIDYFQYHAASLPTLPELCNIAGLSERSLQYGFKEYLGMSPNQYLKIVRLNGARRDLLIASDKNTRVVDVALNWGFLEFGRFAGEYRTFFKELPSDTLRKSQEYR